MKRNEDNVDLDFLKIQYQALSNKQLSHHTSMWNAPSLLFVAQTFLWNISLDNEIGIVIRCIVSFMSIVIAVASLQNFIRNRWMEIADCEQLVAIERLMRKRTGVFCPVMIVHHTFADRTVISPNGKNEEKLDRVLKRNPLFKRSSIGHLRTFYVWKVVLWVVIFLAIIIFVYNLVFAIMIFMKVGSIVQLLGYNIT